jgi:hypothetical protein
MTTAKPNYVFDIENGPLPEAELLSIMPDFDPAEIKTGNAGPEKAAEKIERARAEHQSKFIEKAALSPTTGRVLAIGLLADTPGARPRALLNHDGSSQQEADILSAFWDVVLETEANHAKLAGHNIFGFDLPFLIRRSWLLGVAVPPTLFDRGRYWSDIFVDTMRLWTFGGHNEYVSLDTLSKAFGVGGKPDDVSGADFAGLFFGTAEERKTALDYLKNDLVLTLDIAKKMEVYG